MSKEEVIAELESLLKWLENRGEKRSMYTYYQNYGMCYWVQEKYPRMADREGYLMRNLGLRDPRTEPRLYWFHPEDKAPRIALVKARIEELKQQP